MIGVCKYCGEVIDLCSAHIIPKSFYDIYNNDRYISINKKGNIDSKNFQNGIKDSSILCSKCDNILGLYDKYAKEILFDKIFKNKIPNTSIFSLKQEDFNFNYKKLRLFFISMVWRASISKEINISLGKYEEIALQILKGEKPDNNNLFMPLILKLNNNYKLKNSVFITMDKYLSQKQSLFKFPNYFVSIITNIEPIKDDKLIHLIVNKMFSEKEINILELDSIPKIDKIYNQFIKSL